MRSCLSLNWTTPFLELIKIVLDTEPSFSGERILSSIIKGFEESLLKKACVELRSKNPERVFEKLLVSGKTMTEPSFAALPNNSN